MTSLFGLHLFDLLDAVLVRSHGMVAVAATALMLLLMVLRKGSDRHRKLGRVALVLVLLATVTAAAARGYRDVSSQNDDFISVAIRSYFAVFAVPLLSAAVCAWVSVRQGGRHYAAIRPWVLGVDVASMAALLGVAAWLWSSGRLGLSFFMLYLPALVWLALKVRVAARLRVGSSPRSAGLALHVVSVNLLNYQFLTAFLFFVGHLHSVEMAYNFFFVGFIVALGVALYLHRRHYPRKLVRA